MKKLKCRECSEIWYVDESDLDKLSVCPFCAVPIWEQKVIMEFDTLDKAIYSAIKNMGIDILQNHRQLSGYLMDMAPGLKKEIRIFTKTINEEYLVYVKNAFEEDARNAEITINKLRNLFIEDEGLSENWADMICSNLYEAVLRSKNSVEKSIIVEIEDVSLNIEKDQVTDAGADSGMITKLVESLQPEKIEYLSKVVEENINMAEKYMMMEDYNMALEYYNRAAESGYIAAYNSIANIHHKNGNYRRAWKCYLQSSQMGDSDGEYYVGYYYQEGYHVKKNVNMAHKYYERSAKKNNAKALLALAFQYRNGIGVEKNEKKSIEYIEQAAQSGSVEAQYYLLTYYREGMGKEKNDMMTISKFLKAMGKSYKD